MKLIYITDNPAHAKEASLAGVDYIMVDLEINGKVERQGHLDTVISHHNVESIELIADALRGTDSKTLVRVNPIYNDSNIEVDRAIYHGAERLMLPMFRTIEEIEFFFSLVRGRVPVTLLVETAAALARLPKILKLEGDYNIHVGLNDLHLEMKLKFMFELLIKDGIVEYISELCKHSCREFGFGGVSRLGSELPLSAEEILSEHIRLSSSSVILSRDWHKSIEKGDFIKQVKTLREFINQKIYFNPDLLAEKISLISKSV